MERMAKDRQVVVRQYRCYDPVDWADDAQEHLWLQNQMWNNLVELEQQLYLRYREVMASDPAVASAETEIEAAEALYVKLDDQRKAIRKAIGKKRGVETRLLDDRIAEILASLKGLRKAARELRKAAKERVKPLLVALQDERKAAVKLIYQKSGLWWGNYNGVLNSVDVARSRVMKEGAQLRFHRFDGSGRFRVQVQGGMTVDELCSGSKAIISLEPLSAETFLSMCGKPASRMDPGSRRAQRRSYARLRFTIYTGKDGEGKRTRRVLTFPVLLHRPLPEGDVRLKEATLKRERLGPGQFRWHVTFTFSQLRGELVRHQFPQDACGINLGWKQVDGGLRVATLFSTSGARHYVLPQALVNSYGYLRQLQGRIDLFAEENHVWALQVLSDPPDVMAEPYARLKRAKRPHPGKFARLVSRWREVPEFLPELYQEARRRNEQSRRREIELANLRDKLQARRQDFYRCLAKEITEQYSRIALDVMDFSKLARVETESGAPTELHDQARRRRVIASTGLFREWLVKQAAKTGTEVTKLSLKSSTTCSTCGSPLERQEDLSWKCLHCDTLIDQDENAAINLLRAMNGQ